MDALVDLNKTELPSRGSYFVYIRKVYGEKSMGSLVLRLSKVGIQAVHMSTVIPVSPISSHFALGYGKGRDEDISVTPGHPMFMRSCLVSWLHNKIPTNYTTGSQRRMAGEHVSALNGSGSAWGLT